METIIKQLQNLIVLLILLCEDSSTYLNGNSLQHKIIEFHTFFFLFSSFINRLIALYYFLLHEAKFFALHASLRCKNYAGHKVWLIFYAKCLHLMLLSSCVSKLDVL